eukprot:TRINITY_DN7525_c0_g1_i1.p1 TRINITY_DN7525_c0_g1~~TRINITY_DN7525_c0_g1_i1.p1  ORF type:complete len:1275 (+),score=302.73 TRINITY_DN7525_c0_g1_i1:19-3843(+)
MKYRIWVLLFVGIFLNYCLTTEIQILQSNTENIITKFPVQFNLTAKKFSKITFSENNKMAGSFGIQSCDYKYFLNSASNLKDFSEFPLVFYVENREICLVLNQINDEFNPISFYFEEEILDDIDIIDYKLDDGSDAYIYNVSITMNSYLFPISAKLDQDYDIFTILGNVVDNITLDKNQQISLPLVRLQLICGVSIGGKDNVNETNRLFLGGLPHILENYFNHETSFMYVEILKQYTFSLEKETNIGGYIYFVKYLKIGEMFAFSDLGERFGEEGSIHVLSPVETIIFEMQGFKRDMKFEFYYEYKHHVNYVFSGPIKTFDYVSYSYVYHNITIKQINGNNETEDGVFVLLASYFNKNNIQSDSNSFLSPSEVSQMFASSESHAEVDMFQTTLVDEMYLEGSSILTSQTTHYSLVQPFDGKRLTYNQLFDSKWGIFSNEFGSLHLENLNGTQLELFFLEDTPSNSAHFVAYSPDKKHTFEIEINSRFRFIFDNDYNSAEIVDTTGHFKIVVVQPIGPQMYEFCRADNFTHLDQPYVEHQLKCGSISAEIIPEVNYNQNNQYDHIVTKNSMLLIDGSSNIEIHGDWKIQIYWWPKEDEVVFIFDRNHLFEEQTLTHYEEYTAVRQRYPLNFELPYDIAHVTPLAINNNYARSKYCVILNIFAFDQCHLIFGKNISNNQIVLVNDSHINVFANNSQTNLCLNVSKEYSIYETSILRYLMVEPILNFTDVNISKIEISFDDFDKVVTFDEIFEKNGKFFVLLYNSDTILFRNVFGYVLGVQMTIDNVLTRDILSSEIVQYKTDLFNIKLDLVSVDLKSDYISVFHYSLYSAILSYQFEFSQYFLKTTNTYKLHTINICSYDFVNEITFDYQSWGLVNSQQKYYGVCFEFFIDFGWFNLFVESSHDSMFFISSKINVYEYNLTSFDSTVKKQYMLQRDTFLSVKQVFQSSDDSCLILDILNVAQNIYLFPQKWNSLFLFRANDFIVDGADHVNISISFVQFENDTSESTNNTIYFVDENANKDLFYGKNSTSDKPCVSGYWNALNNCVKPLFHTMITFEQPLSSLIHVQNQALIGYSFNETKLQFNFLDSMQDTQNKRILTIIITQYSDFSAKSKNSFCNLKFVTHGNNEYVFTMNGLYETFELVGYKSFEIQCSNHKGILYSQIVPSLVSSFEFAEDPFIKKDSFCSIVDQTNFKNCNSLYVDTSFSLPLPLIGIIIFFILSIISFLIWFFVLKENSDFFEKSDVQILIDYPDGQSLYPNNYSNEFVDEENENDIFL